MPILQPADTEYVMIRRRLPGAAPGPARPAPGPARPAPDLTRLAFTWAALAGALSLSPSVSEAAADRSFKDWWVACDNLRSCSAYGPEMAPADDHYGAWLRLGREGAATAPLTARIGMILVDQTVDGAATLKVGGDAGPAVATAPARIEGGVVLADLPAETLPALLDQLRHADTLPVTLSGGAVATPVKAGISLSGSAAAMLFLDDAQGRVGTVTAAWKPGPKPAEAVPPVPDLPVIRAAPASRKPVPAARPAILSYESDDGACDSAAAEQFAPIIERLDDTHVLYGRACFSGAYNVAYDFFVAADGAEPVPAVFDAPDGLMDAAELINPGYDPATRTLSTFAKGRGIGDCGVGARWVWDGARFRLAGMEMMGICQGIAWDDWPVVYRAKVEGVD